MLLLKTTYLRYVIKQEYTGQPPGPKLGYQVTWRNLTWKEFRTLLPLKERSSFQYPMDLAMQVYELCRVEGPVPPVVPAGIAIHICQQQMANNPFGGDIDAIRQGLSLGRMAVEKNWLIAAKAMISSALHVPIQAIDDWDADQFFVRLAQ